MFRLSPCGRLDGVYASEEECGLVVSGPLAPVLGLLGFGLSCTGSKIGFRNMFPYYASNSIIIS